MEISASLFSPLSSPLQQNPSTLTSKRGILYLSSPQPLHPLTLCASPHNSFSPLLCPVFLPTAPIPICSVLSFLELTYLVYFIRFFPQVSYSFFLSLSTGLPTLSFPISNSPLLPVTFSYLFPFIVSPIMLYSSYSCLRISPLLPTLCTVRRRRFSQEYMTAEKLGNSSSLTVRYSVIHH